jgi:hypothetical protein
MGKAGKNVKFGKIIPLTLRENNERQQQQDNRGKKTHHYKFNYKDFASLR